MTRSYEDIMDFLDNKIEQNINIIVNTMESWIQAVGEEDEGDPTNSLYEARRIKNELDLFKATRDKLREYAVENTKLGAKAREEKALHDQFTWAKPSHIAVTSPPKPNYIPPTIQPLKGECNLGESKEIKDLLTDAVNRKSREF